VVLVLFMGLAMLLSPAQGVVRQEVRWGMMCGLSKPNSGITLWSMQSHHAKPEKPAYFVFFSRFSLAI